jgi:uncharacterized protein YndB with AHSA1/START domain
MQIAIRVQTQLDQAPQDVFDALADLRNFPRFIARLGPIPGVADVQWLDGAQPGAGARRRLAMSDGTTVDEEVLVFERGTEHRYRWVHPPAPPFSFLVSGGEGCFTFDRSGHGTKLVWSYALTLTSPLAYPLALPVTWLFRRWMAQGLSRVTGLFSA